MKREDFERISDYLWEIPKSYREDMRVPARIYATEEILEKVEERSFRQVVNVATLPGIVKYSLAMPDIHMGYGFVIGGVAATQLPEGVISPGGIGFDQNCGVRLLKSGHSEEELQPHLEKLATQMQRKVPSGLGKGRKEKFSLAQLEKIIQRGVRELVEKGWGEKADIENCEAQGRLKEAEASAVSKRAKNRGRGQVGTLGSGNHFLEVQKVTQIFDEKTAQAFGLFKNQMVVMIHSGSRGFGHQVCTDYLKEAGKAMSKYKIHLPDRQLACFPFDSPEGQRFFKAMACGANYAWANRQMITHLVRKAWKKVLGKRGKLTLLYDVAHNIAKVENYQINGKERSLLVHRKGATRAFPPGHPEVPERYRQVGQPVLIPGSMGMASYVLAGTGQGEAAFYSTCHGAGRRMSRKAATRKFPGQKVVQNLQKQGIIVKCHSFRGIAEEAPGAYKEVDEVVEVTDQAGLSHKVAKLTPLAVIKGE